jgi:hypothetical protein
MRSDGRCKSCGAPIRWALHERTERRMPLDALANPDGNISVVAWGGKQGNGLSLPIIGVNVPPDKAMTPMHYTSHFATCPNADDHRKKR